MKYGAGMKRLIVMRHAKSDWDAGAANDHERPLNARGRREAPSVGERLAELGATPDLAIVSDAARTRETWARVAKSFPKAEMALEPAFYLAGIDAVRDRLERAPRDAKTILVLGHNPGWEEMATELAADRVELKTSYAAIFETDDDAPWSELLAPGKLRLAKVVKPSE
jgi:phosphohistidine phosphatase